MEKYLPVIKNSSLFSDISDDETLSMLKCLSPEFKCYSKGDVLIRAGDTIGYFGLLLSGSIHIINEDFWGNRNIITEITPGEAFGECYACISGAVLNISAVAVTEVCVLYMNVQRILRTCSSACIFHTHLIHNLLSILAERNVAITSKLSFVTQRTTRKKLLAYLSAEAQRSGSSTFDIPFNRQQLADFLSVERSAMSNELSRLRDEGVLTFEKNHFALLDMPAWEDIYKT